MEPDKFCGINAHEHHPEWCGFNYGSGSAIWKNFREYCDIEGRELTLYDPYL